MKNTKLYAVGIPTFFFLSALLLFNQIAPVNSAGEQTSPPSPPTSQEEPEPPTSWELPPENPSSHPTKNPQNIDDFSIEITQLDENIHFLIHNHSDEALVYSMHYSLSKLEDETWFPVELHMAFIEIACILPANSTAEDTVYLDTLDPQLDSGTYRLEKILDGVQYHDIFTID